MGVAPVRRVPHDIHDHTRVVACAPALAELLSFEAPYLLDKLTTDQMVPSRVEAAALFQEVKKYLALQRAHPGRHIPMFSRRVDETWHQFVLFTLEYRDFCRRFFDGYVHHAPELGPSAVLRAPGPSAMSFEEFSAAYTHLFAEAVSPMWRDELFVTRDTRVLRAKLAERVYLRERGPHAAGPAKVELVWDRTPERTLLRTDAWAARALTFVIEHDAFHVRELPGLESADQVALCAPLVAKKFLWVAP